MSIILYMKTVDELAVYLLLSYRRAEKIFAKAKDYLDAEIVDKYPACEYLLSKALAICPMHATKNLSSYYL